VKWGRRAFDRRHGGRSAKTGPPIPTAHRRVATGTKRLRQTTSAVDEARWLLTQWHILKSGEQPQSLYYRRNSRQPILCAGRFRARVDGPKRCTDWEESNATRNGCSDGWCRFAPSAKLGQFSPEPLQSAFARISSLAAPFCALHVVLRRAPARPVLAPSATRTEYPSSLTGKKPCGKCGVDPLVDPALAQEHHA
jgi:hypothetical protein